MKNSISISGFIFVHRNLLIYFLNYYVNEQAKLDEQKTHSRKAGNSLIPVYNW